ncbi:MAG TPA: hypothetical protein VFV38_15055 [Ktedonobacteraceae bacterium]|nr:hypothetical protein [Ktedonobacteraceae bacterium]
MAGLAWKGLIHSALAVLFVFCYTALTLLLVLHHLLRVSSVGIMRPSRMVFFAAIALDSFFRINRLNVLLLLYLPALPLLVATGPMSTSEHVQVMMDLSWPVVRDQL